MTVQDTDMIESDNNERDKDELDSIRVAEINRRTQLIMERDNISREEAHVKATEWISSDIGVVQLPLPIDPAISNVYRVYYRRLHDSHESEYRLLNAVVKGKLYDWPSTHTVLADIIRNRFDKLCDFVVVFHPTTDHDIDPPETKKENATQLDELAKRRQIVELEEKIKRLKES